MNSSLQIPSLLSALTYLLKDSNKNHTKLVHNARTLLRIYVLPYLSFAQFSAGELEQALDDCLAQVTITDFLQNNPTTILDAQLDQLQRTGKIKAGTVRNYRSVLQRFLDQLEQLPPSVLDQHHPAAIVVGTTTPISGRTPHLPGRNLDTDRRGKGHHELTAYRLKPSEYPPRLERQITANLYELTADDFEETIVSQLQYQVPHMGFHYFCTAQAVANRKDDKYREVTFDQTLKHINIFLGWYARIWPCPQKSEPSLVLLAHEVLLEEYITWGISERGNGYGWAHQVACSSLRVLKWLYHRCSQHSHYQDIDAIQRRRAYIDELHQKYQAEGFRNNSAKDLGEKLLTFKQCQELVQRLRQQCADRRTCDRSRRSPSAVLASWQRYLTVAVLTYCPIRQYEIRRLQLNLNLFREPDGYWVSWDPTGHKNGSKTGKGRDFPLSLPPEQLSDLDFWLGYWQPFAKKAAQDCDTWLQMWSHSQKDKIRWQKIFEQVEFQDDLVFFSLGSNPHRESFGHMWTASNFFSMVTKTVYQFTGQRTSPHIFRNIGITHQRQNGDPGQRIALAEVMGHDPATADKIYDLTNSRDKSKKAKDWWIPKAQS